jgi:hypothetical protein
VARTTRFTCTTHDCRCIAHSPGGRRMPTAMFAHCTPVSHPSCRTISASTSRIRYMGHDRGRGPDECVSVGTHIHCPFNTDVAHDTCKRLSNDLEHNVFAERLFAGHRDQSVMHAGADRAHVRQLHEHPRCTLVCPGVLAVRRHCKHSRFTLICPSGSKAGTTLTESRIDQLDLLSASNTCVLRTIS